MKHAWTWAFVALVGTAGLALAEGASDSTLGGGWILLDLEDLNARLVAEGFPALPAGAPLWSSSSLFPIEDSPWRWGISSLAWTLQAADRVLLQTGFVGGALDRQIRPLPNGRVSLSLAGGLSLASLSVRKGRALDFDEVVNPGRGQLSQVIRWGGWLAPRLSYELAPAGDGLVLRAGLGWLWAPWQSGWQQLSAAPNPFDPLAFTGPPARLGGPFFAVQLRFSLRT